MSAFRSELHLHTFTANFDDTTVQLIAVLRDGEPWLHGRTLATQLGFKYLDVILRNNVDEEDKDILENDLYVSEDGVDSLLRISKVPYKKAFSHWVWKAVLPKLAQYAQAAEHEEASAAAPSATAPLPSSSQSDTATEPESPPPAIEPAHVDWERHKQKLEALAAARALAQATGMTLGEAHRRAMNDAINEVVLPAGHEQKDMISAAEFLRRKGHTPEETLKLATEFGKALKHACMFLRRDEPVTNTQTFTTATSDVRMYHALDDGLFLEEVYAKFATRSLYVSNCAGYEQARTQMRAQVAAALQNARGFASGMSRRPSAGNRR